MGANLNCSKLCDCQMYPNEIIFSNAIKNKRIDNNSRLKISNNILKTTQSLKINHFSKPSNYIYSPPKITSNVITKRRLLSSRENHSSSNNNSFGEMSERDGLFEKLLYYDKKCKQYSTPNEYNIKIKRSNYIEKKDKNNNCVYKGQLDDNMLFNGKGKLYFNDGRKYKGFFEKGKLNGLGRYIDNEGNCYEGIFKDFELISKGKIIQYDKNNNDKIIYIGEIKNLKREGKGEEYCKDYYYKGEFHNNKKHGWGILEFNDGQKYEGSFIENKIMGYGKYYWTNGHKYIGDLNDGKMEGKGLYIWSDGNEYEGEYKNNLKEGEGEFRWKNGNKYKGNFNNGVPNGKGIITVDNISINVIFEDGKLIGDLNDLIKNHKNTFSPITKKSTANSNS